MTDTGQESGPFGNVYDKYGTKNPIARRMMAGFLGEVGRLYTSCAPARVLEVGCGEGELATRLISLRSPAMFVATDVETAPAASIDPRIQFQKASVYALPFPARSFDLVICCEVLEHLAEPARALQEIRRVAGHWLIASTPREPLWRALNMARGKYLRDLGNTPGHVQHFNRRSLVDLIGTEFTVRDVTTPLPWTIVRAECT